MRYAVRRSSDGKFLSSDGIVDLSTDTINLKYDSNGRYSVRWLYYIPINSPKLIIEANVLKATNTQTDRLDINFCSKISSGFGLLSLINDKYSAGWAIMYETALQYQKTGGTLKDISSGLNYTNQLGITAYGVDLQNKIFSLYHKGTLAYSINASDTDINDIVNNSKYVYFCGSSRTAGSDTIDMSITFNFGDKPFQYSYPGYVSLYDIKPVSFTSSNAFIY